MEITNNKMYLTDPGHYNDNERSVVLTNVTNGKWNFLGAQHYLTVRDQDGRDRRVVFAYHAERGLHEAIIDLEAMRLSEAKTISINSGRVAILNRRLTSEEFLGTYHVDGSWKEQEKLYKGIEDGKEYDFGFICSPLLGEGTYSYATRHFFRDGEIEGIAIAIE